MGRGWNASLPGGGGRETPSFNLQPRLNRTGAADWPDGIGFANNPWYDALLGFGP